MLTVSTEQIRAIEKRAMANGLSASRLMENAGAAAARYIRSLSVQPQSTVILCGRGNNGGDGFVIARKLWENGYTVTVVLTDGAPVSDVAAEAFGKLPPDIVCIYANTEPYRAAAEVTSAGIVVDAVYGIGFHGTLPPTTAQLFGQVNPTQQLCVAVDIPSGMEGDTGVTAANTFRAAYTLTFIAAKHALAMQKNASFCGKLEVLSIGIAQDDIFAILQADMLQREEISALLPSRKVDAHKGDCGHALLVCGSYGMAGAAILSAKAALRSGIGLVTVALPKSIYPIVAAAVPEAVFLPLPETEKGVLDATALQPLLRALRGKTALLIGCGLGKGESVEIIVQELLLNASCPVVVDADGLNALSRHIDVLETVKTSIILTPHVGEMARLCGKDTTTIQQYRRETAIDFAHAHNVTLVLKGHHTVVADAHTCRINPTGNAGMATGGSGDMLAGMIASFAAQGVSPTQAAWCGVYLHGAAGDRAAEKWSQRAMLPSDMLEVLGELFLNLP